jgi:ectoine hydroxylase-related dioxygenase (phytanoyl-CoA dioxygenase family)
MLEIDNKLYDFTKKQFDFYDENGFIVIKNLFSSEEVGRIYHIFTEYADENFSAILNLDREIEELHNVMKMPRVVSIVESIFEGEAYGLMTQMLFKQSGTKYSNQSWTIHQDNSYHQNPNGKTLTINIACEDTDVENGTLYLYPGTHKEGIINFEQRKSFREDKGRNPGNTLQLPDKYLNKKKDIAMNKGDVLFLHGNCAHGSYGNLSKYRSRPLYSITYIKKGEQFAIGKNANRKEFSLH